MFFFIKCCVYFEITVEEKKRSTTLALEESRKKVKDEISDLKDTLNMARLTIEQFKNALANAQKSPHVPGSSSPKKSGSFSEQTPGTSKSSGGVVVKVEDTHDTNTYG